MTFSPLEELVLSRLVREWRTREQVVRELFPEHPPSTVRAAFDFLKRHRLIREIPAHEGLSYWEPTQAGQEQLAYARRSRSPLHPGSTHVR